MVMRDTSMSLLLTFPQNVSPPTLMEKVLHYVLSPSTVDQGLIYPLAKLLFHQSTARTFSDLISKVFKEELHLDKSTFQNQTLPKNTLLEMKQTVALVKCHRKMTLGVAQIEASSYTILGILGVFFSKAMMDIHEREYRYIPQMTVARNSLPGQNPSSDPSIAGELTGSVALAQAETNPTLTELGEFVPRVIYECKPVLAGHFELINNKAMIESLLQANYCLRFHKLQCLFACLTDLITWQYYQVELSPDSLVSMKITAYYKIQHSLLLILFCLMYLCLMYL